MNTTPTILLLPIAILILSAYVLLEAGSSLGPSSSPSISIALLSPATAPALWSIALATCSLSLLFCEIRDKRKYANPSSAPSKNPDLPAKGSLFADKTHVIRKVSRLTTVGLCGVYIIFLDQGILDYYQATSIFLLTFLTTSLILNVEINRPSILKMSLIISGTTLSWLVFVYAVFDSLLSISLPDAQIFSQISLTDFTRLIW